jgi:hypothetical protein
MNHFTSDTKPRGLPAYKTEQPNDQQDRELQKRTRFQTLDGTNHQYKTINKKPKTETQF